MARPDHHRLGALQPAEAFRYAAAGFAAFFLVLTLFTGFARADTAPRTVTPNDMGTGGLLLKTKEPGRYIEAPLVAADVDIDITGPIARTRVTQRFENPGDGWVEGVYVFPLPEESAVDSLRMLIGDRVIEGEIKEKEEARQIYEKAKEDGKRASLVEQNRPNIFTNSVANIGPGETVVVQIEYQQTVRQSGEEFSLRFPMVVAPRYMPAPSVHLVDFAPGEGGWGSVSDPVPDREHISPPVQHPDEGKRNPVTLTVSLDAGFPLGDIESPHHKMRVVRDGESRAALTLDAGEVPADKDFELTWTPASTTAPTAALFREHLDGEDYILMMLMPPQKLADEAERQNREVIFVIDNSGSMSGQSMPQAKASLELALKRLTPQDRFNVVRFNHTHEALFPAAMRADAENVGRAAGFVRGLEAEGGTEMLGALQTALSGQPADGYLRQVVFLTDGAVGNEAQLFQTISQRLGDSRLFTVGIGSAPNSYFMARAAEMGRGTHTHIGEPDQVTARMEELFVKLENPAMTDLAAVWPDGTKAEAWPTPLPDLYLGEPIVLSAKMKEANGTFKLTGMFDGKSWEMRLPLDKATERPGVAKLWARKKIASLEGMRHADGDWQKIDAEITEVALHHHLVSRLTSLVAVDKTPARPDGEEVTRRDVPLNLPDGWDFEAVFGEAAPAAPMRDARALNVRPMLAMAAAPAPQAEAAKGMALPQTATEAERLMLTGGLLMLFALTFWVLTIFWRHLGAQAKAAARGAGRSY
ncbi:marine proteobacterial sortase target protein [Tepidicaulis sp. LMO-SS28]|uniref:marine proteobacterial sortase target protein n=1 Tax=Tepidicaulis sp. LMO-SS28 TaxID=3447455 RepID=UPI003EDF79F9